MNKLIAQTTKNLFLQINKINFATQPPQKASSEHSQVDKVPEFDPMQTVTRRKRPALPVNPYKKKYFEQ